MFNTKADEFTPRGTVVVTPEKLGLLYSRFKIEGEVHPFEGEHSFIPLPLLALDVFST